MSKINTANILKGLNNVVNITSSLTNTAKDEMIPVDQIELAAYNPAASNDTESDYYDLAKSIQANGLLQPLVLNQLSNNRYQLIAGEKRLTAIKKHLPEMRTVRCMVYQNLDPDEAQIKLHEANNYREYTSEQKLKIYQDLVSHYQKLKDRGKFSGNTQKAIAECLNISDRQARKYKQITENLTEEQIQDIYKGELSINSAYDIAKAPPTLKKETNPDPMFTTPAQEIGESKPAAAQPEKNSESARTKSISPQKKAQPEPDTAKAEPVPPSIPSPDPATKFSQETDLFPLTFPCCDANGTHEATVTSLQNYGSHYEIVIEGQSKFTFYIGKSINGHFMCAPEFGAGCQLASYSDCFWNIESLQQQLPEPDARETAYAIKHLVKNGFIKD